MKCPHCGYSDNFVQSYYDREKEYCHIDMAPPDIVERVRIAGTNVPIEINGFTYRLSPKGDYIHRLPSVILNARRGKWAEPKRYRDAKTNRTMTEDVVEKCRETLRRNRLAKRKQRTLINWTGKRSAT